MRKIVIALPKGKRLLTASYGIFKKAGYVSVALEQAMGQDSPKQLEFPCECARAVFLLVKNADIPQYVDRNWAELGITAFDCYREYELSSVMNSQAGYAMRGDNFISTLLPDLALCGQARFCVAGRPESRDFYEACTENDDKVLTAATQYPGIAAHFFKGRGILVDIVTVSGSAELMPAHGSVDVIFDIVESGNALRENGLVIYEEAMPIQTKILVSKAAYKYDANLAEMVGILQNAIKQGPKSNP